MAGELARLTPAAPIASPCTGVCRIEPASARCVGCARTLTEIADWAAMTDAERAAVMRELPSRKR